MPRLYGISQFIYCFPLSCHLKQIFYMCFSSNFHPACNRIPWRCPINHAPLTCMDYKKMHTSLIESYRISTKADSSYRLEISRLTVIMVKIARAWPSKNCPNRNSYHHNRSVWVKAYNHYLPLKVSSLYTCVIFSTVKPVP